MCDVRHSSSSITTRWLLNRMMQRVVLLLLQVVPSAGLLVSWTAARSRLSQKVSLAHRKDMRPETFAAAQQSEQPQRPQVYHHGPPTLLLCTRYYCLT